MHIVLLTLVALATVFGGSAVAEVSTRQLSPGTMFVFDGTRYMNTAGCTFLEANVSREPVGDMAITILEGHTIPLQADPANIARISCRDGALTVSSSSNLLVIDTADPNR